MPMAEAPSARPEPGAKPALQESLFSRDLTGSVSEDDLRVQFW